MSTAPHPGVDTPHRTLYNTGMETQSTHFEQVIIEARDAKGATEFFGFGYYFTREDAEAKARAFAGERGSVTLVGRNRLNDYVGSPIWSEPTLIERIA